MVVAGGGAGASLTNDGRPALRADAMLRHALRPQERRRKQKEQERLLAEKREELERCVRRGSEAASVHKAARS